jgi:8-oxo-dGTP pyrophosphatase MutT (NUDIX family)
MAANPNWIYQAAAVPIRNGQLCLVTSSSGKRWVIPKGCMEPGKTEGQIALQEAWEEAGLVGILEREPVGSYLYEKWGNVCHVTVFLMHVTSVAEEWPEKLLRQRRWLNPADAIDRIEDPGLRDLLTHLRSADRLEPWVQAPSS